MIFPRMSLDCKLVPVQPWEYEYCLLCVTCSSRKYVCNVACAFFCLSVCQSLDAFHYMRPTGQGPPRTNRWKMERHFRSKRPTEWNAGSLFSNHHGGRRINASCLRRFWGIWNREWSYIGRWRLVNCRCRFFLNIWRHLGYFEATIPLYCPGESQSHCRVTKGSCEQLCREAEFRWLPERESISRCWKFAYTTLI